MRVQLKERSPTEKMSELTNGNTETYEPMAIVGMAMRLPGEVYNGEDFWNLLVEKRSGSCDVPKDRYNIDAFYDANDKPGTVRTKQGYFLNTVDIQQFDSSVFTTSKKELERLDPQQRQLLEVSYECLENAGCTSYRDSKIACYVGVFTEDWQDLNAKETQHMGGYRVTGYGDFTLSNRVSYEFDLHGPRSIQVGECDGALVEGVNMIFSPTMTLALSDQGVLSPTGSCKSFDAAADGYARGEAVSAIYIKKLSQALADGDPVRAVIRGTSVNTDGRTQGMLTPSSISQEALIRRAYEVAGISDLCQTAIVECHGTGTSAGDPLEAAAVAKCFGEKGVIITSVKPNVGHSEGAAGLTSLIKGVLALEHHQVPPNINFSTPNPKIPFEECKLHVPIELEQWPQGRAERISVNSFGIGGVNAHVILESVEQYSLPEPKEHETVVQEPLSQQHLMLLSACSEESLKETIENHRKYTQDNASSLRDIAYTLSNHRLHHAYRAYAVAKEASDWQVSAIETVKSKPTIAWVFTGQGAQWPEMGAQLIDTNPVFQTSIRNLDQFLLSLPNAPSWTIEVHRAEMGHPLSIALQIGLIDVLKSWGIVPKLVFGHSSGEMAAAYASGAITAEGAMAAATFRGISNTESTQKGSMAAIGLGRADVTPYLESGVVIACENSHMSVTLAGDAEPMVAVVNRIKADHPDILARFLKVEKAFHSHHMKEYGASYREHIGPFITSVDPKIPFYSAVTGDRLTGNGCLGPAYWRQNMESPVLFNSSMRAVLRDHKEKLVFIEIGPHSALKGPMGQILRDTSRSEEVHIGTLQRNKSCHESLLQCAGNLFQQHVALDFASLFPVGRCVKDMPRYAWKRDASHWSESRVANEWRFREYPPHDLLGIRVIETGSQEPHWRNRLALENVPWLGGHEVSGQTVFPAAGYISMIGEALRQLNSGTEGESTYSLRNVRIASAMVLEPERVSELLTSLKPMALDSSDQTPWYSFTISSFDGNNWVRNCYGEARKSVEKSSPFLLGPEQIIEYPRKVDENYWYNILTKLGFEYTGAFRGLQKITSGTVTSQAAAVVPFDEKHNQGDQYPVHPAVIDQCFQIFTVAAARGRGRAYRQIAVPTFIEEIVIAPSNNGHLDAMANIDSYDRGSFVGHLSAQSGGKAVLSLTGFKATALSYAESASDELPLINQLEWKPHSDFADMSKLMRPRQHCPSEWLLLEELILLCMLDHQRRLTFELSAEHLVKFLAWQQKQIDRYRNGHNNLVPADRRLEDLDEENLLARIESIAAQVKTSPYAVFATAIHKLFHSATAIFKNEAHPLHILREEDVLSEFYAVVDGFLDYADAIQVLGNTNPQLRVLEIGAGTGGTTRKIISALTSSYGERLYSSYTFTDISAGFMTDAKELLREYEGIEFMVFDVTQDPIAQGFELEKYDLIVASNVIHATPSLQESLRTIRSLLSPVGCLFLQELTPEAKFYDYVMGYLSGWWLGNEDGRTDQPYVTVDRWSTELVAAGFREPVSILDGIAPYHSNAGILATVQSTQTPVTRITLLCYDPEGPYVQEFLDRLLDLEITTDVCNFGSDLPPSQDIISLLEIENSIVHDMSEETFKTLLNYLQTLQSNVLWVTPAAQVNCKDPRSAMILGLARTARNELSIPLYTVEVDSETAKSVGADAVVQILLRINTVGLDSEVMDPDWEFAIVKGEILVPRLHWQTVSSALDRSHQSDFATSQRITIGTPGLLHTMQWEDQKIESLKEDEVRIQTKAAGLNFMDVLISLGVISIGASDMGLEGAGIIEAIGPNVNNLAVGDRVLYMSTGCFSTSFTLSEKLCIRLSNDMSFVKAASLPCVYGTAIMALIDKANLQPGQSVLIHSAAGGVGLAAIQIAQMIGAKIYCTVGSEAKIEYLVQNHHIERCQIFNSRDSSFLRDIMQATDNEGVDVALNSLSGDLLHATWNCVAKFGTMVEIGKRDFQRRAKLSMELFEANRTFVGLDLRDLNQQKPEKVVERCVRWIDSGKITPDAVTNTFPASQIQESFRFMQGGRHIGKIVIEMPHDAKSPESSKIKPVSTLRPDRTYFLVGGLGGLGRAVATWMVEHGARYLIFLSRSAGTQNTIIRDFVQELHSQGCAVQLVAGSVSEKSDIQRAIKNAEMPIGGVINMSMVLKDIPLSGMTFSDWMTAVEPKVRGTWNLHEALEYQPTPLDFFILYSSFSGVAGQRGQANYASANTFLDAFVQYRHSKGLAASVIDIGVMGEVGFVSQNNDTLERFEKTGMHLCKEQDLLDAMTLAIERSSPKPQPDASVTTYQNPSQIMLGLHTTIPITSPSNRVDWKRDMRTIIYRNINSGNEGSSSPSSSDKNSDLRNFVVVATGNPNLLADDPEGSATIIAQALAVALESLLIKENISLNDSLPASGVDSLVAMEVKNWIKQQLSIEVSTFTLLQNSPLIALGENLRVLLATKLGLRI
ncbi:hypothetical protein N7478_004633 [Penicillium angulare]|uniref:uncharacterized protein n=1 Tax=Penicillium angulare TaxID=116970 RepID=UPI0025401D4D|nr:uncharacterized protein N7478_004633 [Penicillium angulare]KAJ5279261.1 hypothetical protein N7478_004633 [Penicillium angulare]